MRAPVTMWQITAQVSRRQGEWRGVRQIPTFYLNGSLQGIVSADHAARIARSVIDPYAELAADELSVHADPVQMPVLV